MEIEHGYFYIKKRRKKRIVYQHGPLDTICCGPFHLIRRQDGYMYTLVIVITIISLRSKVTSAGPVCPANILHT